MKVDNIRWRFINLDSRPDRLVMIEAEMAKVGIVGQRVRGMLPNNAAGSLPELAYMRAEYPGQVGCYLSHRTLWEAWQGRTEVLGVLEDDAILCDDFQERLAYIQEKLTWPWDIFFLGSCYHCNPPYWHKHDLGKDFEQTIVPYIHRLYGAFGTQGYLLNPASIPKLLALMDRELCRTYAIDHLLILLGPELDWYGFTPGMVFQRDGHSDVRYGTNQFSDFYRLCGPYVFAKYLADFDYFSFDWKEGRYQKL